MRLLRFLTSIEYNKTMLLVGGGRRVESLRQTCRKSGMSESEVHWRAIELMEKNSIELSSDLPIATVTDSFRDFLNKDSGHFLIRPSNWARSRLQLPENWQVTSDSIAAELCRQLAANDRASDYTLYLLKSIARPAPIAGSPITDWQMLADIGAVDRYFPVIANQLPNIVWVHFREKQG